MEYTCITTTMELQNYLGNSKLIAFDFETAPDAEFRNEARAALDAHKAHIVGVSFSVAEGTAVYVPMRHSTGMNANEKEMMCFLAELMENTEIIKVAHNMSFEAMFLYAQGIVVQQPCYDTIASSQMTLKSNTEFRTLHDSGLKTLVPALLNIEMPSFETVTAGRCFDELNPQAAETINYACADSDYTLRLYHLFNTWFDRFLPKHRYIVEQVESPTAVYCGMMKYNGLLMDKELMLQKQIEAESKLQSIRSDIAFIIGDVNIGENASTSALKKYLFTDLKLPVLKVTAKYQEAADDETLILLKEWCTEHRPELTSLFDLVQEYRQWGKIKSTYIDGYLQHINPATGCIHPDMFPLGAESGRFSCRKPNLQNQGGMGNSTINVRNFTIAPEGQSLIEVDYSQIELRIAAYLSMDETMLTAYLNDEDLHAITTAALYGISLEEAADKNNTEYKKRRTVAKSSIFGVLYGIYKRGLQRNLKTAAGLNFTEDECNRFIQSIKTKFNTLATWQEKTVQQSTVRKYAETQLGRRRYVPDIASTDFKKRSGAERTALNHGVQGLAADLLKLSMGRLLSCVSEHLWMRPVLSVHDSLVFYVPDEKIDESVLLIKDCMEVPLPIEGFNVPIVAEASSGKDYGSMKEVR